MLTIRIWFKKFYLLAFLIMMGAPLAAQASVIYEFHSQGSTFGSFIYESPDFITENTEISPAAGLLYCSTNVLGDCLSPGFFVDTTHHLGMPDSRDAIGFRTNVWDNPDLLYQMYFTYFDNGALSAFGTYQSSFDFNPGTLIVRSGQLTVPEPSSVVLLALALFGLLLLRRKV